VGAIRGGILRRSRGRGDEGKKVVACCGVTDDGCGICSILYWATNLSMLAHTTHILLPLGS
jgi:hypothetical protein